MGNKIVYKGYNVGETTQVSIMPTATADNSGAIVQYVGTTNANYINGYFYKCVSDGGVTPTYSWEKIQVSDGGDTYTAGFGISISDENVISENSYIGTKAMWDSKTIAEKTKYDNLVCFTDDWGGKYTG